MNAIIGIWIIFALVLLLIYLRRDPYVGRTIILASGTGAGQSATIESYNRYRKVLTIEREWKTLPDDTSSFVLGEQK